MVVKARRVVLMGNSVVSSSLASTLGSRPELEVLQIDAATPETARLVRSAHPDAIVICEPADTSLDLIFLLLGECPGLPVIGVDLDGYRMVVLSSREAGLCTEEDLLEAIGEPGGLLGCAQALSRRSRIGG